MSSITDAAFEAWLNAVVKDHGRDWVRRNMPALERTYRETGGAPMLPCPPAPASKARDRYDEL